MRIYGFFGIVIALALGLLAPSVSTAIGAEYDWLYLQRDAAGVARERTLTLTPSGYLRIAASGQIERRTGAEFLADIAAQPVDADLTSIAALATTAYGRSLLIQADAAAARTTLALTSAAIGNAAGLTSDTLADARLSSNVMTLTGEQTVTGTKTFGAVGSAIFGGDAVSSPTIQLRNATGTSFTINHFRNNSHRWSVLIGGAAGDDIVFRSVTSAVDRFIFDYAGNLRLGGSVIFDGATVDANRTTITVIDPTAARTITIPNASGTVPLLGIAQTYSAINTYTAGVVVGTAGATVLGVRSASASLDYASIAAGAEATLTITVTGAVTTNTPTIALGWSAALPDGIVVKQAWLSAADTVSVPVVNISAGAIDPPAVTCRATVTQF